MKNPWLCAWWIAVALFGGLLLTFGTAKTFSAWGIKTTQPLFPDARGITSGLESHALGMDPLVENPRDPWHRTLNYPRVWLSLSHFGINQSHTVLFGRTLIGLFLIGLLLFPPPDLNGIGLALILLTAFSPASVLGMERGNIDALVFFLISLAVIGISRKGSMAGGLAVTSVYLAFILKLYPMFAMSIILGQNKIRFLKTLAWVVPMILIYLIVTWNDLVLIYNATPKATGLSYGMNVMWMKVSEHGPALGKLARLAAYLGVGIAAALSWAGFRWGSGSFRKIGINPKTLGGFRAGAGIYGGTFLLGNNWDYRLIFLVLTLPLFAQLLRSPCLRFRWLAGVISVAVVLSFWHIVFIQLCEGLSHGIEACVLLDECSNWTVFLGMGFLFGCSMPEWMSFQTSEGKSHSLACRKNPISSMGSR